AAPTNCRRCRAGWVPEPRGCREYHPAWREIFRSQYSFDESAKFIVGRQITIRVGSVAIVRGRRPNVAYWHIAAFAALQRQGRYWGNSGQMPTRTLTGSVARRAHHRPIRTSVLTRF